MHQRLIICRICSTYADDTLLLGTSGLALSAFLRAVADTGAEFGMSLHVGKTQLLKVRSPGVVTTPNGENLTSKPSMIYLGGLLSDDGRSEKELSRRIGLAASDFKKLSRIWSHSNVSTLRKLHIFKSCDQCSNVRIEDDLARSSFPAQARRIPSTVHSKDPSNTSCLH